MDTYMPNTRGALLSHIHNAARATQINLQNYIRTSGLGLGNI